MLGGPAITRVEQLAAHAGYSTRTLQRLFREYVGVTPSGCSSASACTRPPSGWPTATATGPALALDLGYFDQAHFIKAFKAVVGRSPAEYADR